MAENEGLSGIEMLQRLKKKAEQKKQSSILENDKDVNLFNQASEVSDIDQQKYNRQTGTMPDLEIKKAGRQTEVMPGMGSGNVSRQTEAMPGLDLNNADRQIENNYNEIQEAKNNSQYSAEFTLINSDGSRHYKQDGKRITHGGTADIYHVICQEDNNQYVAKIYQENQKNNHIDEFYDEFIGVPLDGLISILDRGICDIMDCSRKFYIIPDYSSFMNLREYIEKYDIDDEQIIHFIKKMAEALHTLHIKGFYHRDIKPENILCDKGFENFLVIDYGSITKGDLEISDTRVTKNIKKTDGYTAPEIYLWYSLSGGDEVQANEKTDFFALGAVLGDIYKSMDDRGVGNDTHLFQDDKDASIASQKNEFPFPGNLNSNKRMLNLVHALLLYVPQSRAGYKEVLEWLDGKELFIDQTDYSKKNRFEYTFNGIKYNSPVLLARGLAENWNRALKEVNRGELLSRIRNMSDDYKEYADGIADIEEYYQKNVKDNTIREDSMLLEIIERLGGNLSFVWKGIIYEKDDGNTDIDCIASKLYEDAISGGNVFNSLVQTRGIKELLYPQIRYISDDSSMQDKIQTGYESKINSVLSINKIANESIELAKFYVIEKCCPGFLVHKLTDGKFTNANDYLKSVFTTNNIDEAFGSIYMNFFNKENAVIKFLNAYIKSDEIRAMLIASYDIDGVFKIKDNEEKANSLLQLLDLLLEIECKNDEKGFSNNILSVNIASEFVNTCFFKAILGYTEAMKTWSYNDYMGAKNAEKIKNIVEKYIKLFSEVKNELRENVNVKYVLTKERSMEENGKEKDNMISLIAKFIPLLEEAKKIFIYDDPLLDSGLIFVTSKNIYSSIVADKLVGKMCLIDDKFLVPKNVAEEIYEPLHIKISNVKPQDEIRKLSIDACKEQTEKFYNNFKNIAGDDVEALAKYSYAKLLWNFIVAVIVVLSGIAIFLSGCSIAVSNVYKSGEINKTFAISIIIADIVLGSIFVLGCYSDCRDAWKNLVIFKDNRNLFKYFGIIETTRTSLENMQAKNKLVKLSIGEAKIIKYSFLSGNSVKEFFEKHKLNSDYASYYSNRTTALLFVAVIEISCLIYNHIPACNMLGVLLEDKIVEAAEYEKKGEKLPPVIKNINQMVSKLSLGMTEANAKRALIGRYNEEKLNEKKFNKEKSIYLGMCENLGYKPGESFEKSLNGIVASKKSYEKGIELNKQGKTKKSISQFINVIETDSNYGAAQKYVSSYVKELYKNQQEYIESGKQHKLNKLVKIYGKLLEGNVNTSVLSDLYGILAEGYDMDETARQLVAYQMGRNRDNWIDDEISRISCVKRARGLYYVRVEKENSGLSWWFNRYSETDYCFSTVGWSKDVSVPDAVQFHIQEFNPDANSYLEYLKN